MRGESRRGRRGYSIVGDTGRYLDSLPARSLVDQDWANQDLAQDYYGMVKEAIRQMDISESHELPAIIAGVLGVIVLLSAAVRTRLTAIFWWRPDAMDFQQLSDMGCAMN